jgi:hypothetical protein
MGPKIFPTVLNRETQASNSMDCMAFDFSPKREKAFPGRGRQRTLFALFARPSPRS